MLLIASQHIGQGALGRVLLFAGAGVAVAVAGRAAVDFAREVCLAVGLHLVTDVLELQLAEGVLSTESECRCE